MSTWKEPTRSSAVFLPDSNRSTSTSRSFTLTYTSSRGSAFTTLTAKPFRFKDSAVSTSSFSTSKDSHAVPTHAENARLRRTSRIWSLSRLIGRSAAHSSVSSPFADSCHTDSFIAVSFTVHPAGKMNCCSNRTALSVLIGGATKPSVATSSLPSSIASSSSVGGMSPPSTEATMCPTRTPALSASPPLVTLATTKVRPSFTNSQPRLATGHSSVSSSVLA